MNENEFKPRFDKRIYIGILFFGISIPILMVKAINDPLDDPMLTISVIGILYLMINTLLFRIFKKIVFDDNQMKLIISYYLIPPKIIEYHEMKELTHYGLITSKGKIYFHIITNREQFLDLLAQRVNNELISFNNESELSETNKYFFQLRAYRIVVFILPLILIGLYFSDIDFGKYGPVLFLLILFLIGFIVYKVLIWKSPNVTLSDDENLDYNEMDNRDFK